MQYSIHNLNIDNYVFLYVLMYTIHDKIYQRN